MLLPPRYPSRHHPDMRKMNEGGDTTNRKHIKYFIREFVPQFLPPLMSTDNKYLYVWLDHKINHRMIEYAWHSIKIKQSINLMPEKSLTKMLININGYSTIEWVESSAIKHSLAEFFSNFSRGERAQKSLSSLTWIIF
jgi:hypothetical protein